MPSPAFGIIRGPVPGYVGGQYTLTVNVYKTGDPLIPVGRRVLLLEQRSRREVGRTWSDPVTGAATFVGLARVPHLAIALDRTGVYGAVIESDLVPVDRTA